MQEQRAPLAICCLEASPFSPTTTKLKKTVVCFVCFFQPTISPQKCIFLGGHLKKKKHPDSWPPHHLPTSVPTSCRKEQQQLPSWDFRAGKGAFFGGGVTPAKTTPWKLTCPQKRDFFNRKYIFQPSFFRGYVSFQGGNMTMEKITIRKKNEKKMYSSYLKWWCSICHVSFPGK